MSARAPAAMGPRRLRSPRRLAAWLRIRPPFGPGAWRLWARLAALLLASSLFAPAARAGDALDAYRSLGRGDRERVLRCARAAIERAVSPARDSASAPADSLAPDWPGPPCGVYLSLARGRSTRACVGSLTPLGGTLGSTLEALARRVVSDDPRHPPVRRDELDTLAVVVSFAGPPLAIEDPMVIAPARDGLLIASARGSVAFLPGEARTVAWALGEARRIGVLERAGEASFQKFSVVALKDAPLPRP